MIGTLRDRMIVDRLDAPRLLIYGHHDEATPAIVQPYVDRISQVEWTLFKHSSQVPHVEERDLCMRTVEAFLAWHGSGGARFKDG